MSAMHDAPAPAPTPAQRRSLRICICTCRRNGPLERLLAAIERNAKLLDPSIDVGIVLVDDDPGQAAVSVAEQWSPRFALGLRYEATGSGSVSIARNRGIESGIVDADLLAWIDDDCEPSDEWLVSLVDVLDRFDADAATGWCTDVPSDDAPGWLSSEPFLERTEGRVDGQRIDIAATKNFMVRAPWLRDHPDQRFDLSLGRLGGEDMVFFYRAVDAGLHIRYAERAKVYERVPEHRTSYRYRVMRECWMGNSEFVTNYLTGRASRSQLARRGAKRMIKGALHPVLATKAGRGPQFRYAAATIVRGGAIVAGCLGARMRHH